MTDSQLKALIAGIRVSHKSRDPALDQDGGPNNLVCSGHGMSYPPPYPCQLIILCDALEERMQRTRFTVGQQQEIDKQTTQLRHESGCEWFAGYHCTCQ